MDLPVDGSETDIYSRKPKIAQGGRRFVAYWIIIALANVLARQKRRLTR